MLGISNKIYFNNNRTTRLDSAVEEAMMAYRPGSDIHTDLQTYKGPIAEMIGADASQILFTKGTTDSIHTGIRNCFLFNSGKGKHIITNQTEHMAVKEACEALRSLGADITYLPVDPEGRVDPASLKAAIRKDTQLVSIMAANNETGVVQPLEEIGTICRDAGITFFSDACQLVGKSRLDVQELEVDCMAFGSHKMYGPEGIGALYVKNSALADFIGSQSPFIAEPRLAAGFSKTAELFLEHYWDTSAHVSRLKNYLEHQLLEIQGLRINGSTRHRLYNTSNLCFPNHKNLSPLLEDFDFAHHFDRDSHVLKAMGLSQDEIKNSYRFSFGKNNTLDEVKLLVEKILGL